MFVGIRRNRNALAVILRRQTSAVTTNGHETKAFVEQLRRMPLSSPGLLFHSCSAGNVVILPLSGDAA
jgi:hypothetical protein